MKIEALLIGKDKSEFTALIDNLDGALLFVDGGKVKIFTFDYQEYYKTGFRVPVFVERNYSGMEKVECSWCNGGGNDTPCTTCSNCSGSGSTIKYDDVFRAVTKNVLLDALNHVLNREPQLQDREKIAQGMEEYLRTIR